RHVAACYYLAIEPVSIFDCALSLGFEFHVVGRLVDGHQGLHSAASKRGLVAPKSDISFYYISLCAPRFERATIFRTGLLHPLHSLLCVLRHALTPYVHRTERQLRIHRTLIRCFSKPHQCKRIVLRDALAPTINIADHFLSERIAL